MAFVPNEDVAKLVFGTSMFGKDYSNTVYFFNAGGWDLASLEDLADAGESRWNANIPPVMSDQCELRQVQAYSLESESSPVFTLPVSPAIPGDLTSPPMPANVTLALTFRTASRGKSSRGRIYITGLVEAQVLENAINPTESTAILTAYTDMLEGITSLTTATHVVYSQYTGGAPRVLGLPLLVTSVTSDFQIDTQRRRVRN